MGKGTIGNKTMGKGTIGKEKMGKGIHSFFYISTLKNGVTLSVLNFCPISA